MKNGTSDSRKDWFAVGDYKKLPNEVGGMDTALPEEVADKMKALLTEYNAKEEKNFAGSLFVVVMPVMVFIICGFNHCIADMFYYFFAGCPEPSKAIVYFILAIAGNSVGGMIVPLLKKLSNQPL